MGGCQGLMKDIARNLTSSSQQENDDDGDGGWLFTAVVTFDMKGVGRSTGRSSLTAFSEVADVVSVCKWVLANLSAHRILLVDSSAGLKKESPLNLSYQRPLEPFFSFLADLLSLSLGAPIAGSAIDQVEEVVGNVSMGDCFDSLWETP